MAIPGFDIGDYPGDAKMKVWKANSPYQWCGYYILSPCHVGFKQFTGKRQVLVDQGWGLLITYLGQQQSGCRASTLTTAQGNLDARDAHAKVRAEGFADGSMIYLDVEQADIITTGMHDYIASFCDALISLGSFLPGLYCHRSNAKELMPVVKAAYHATGEMRKPRFWIVGGPNTTTLNYEPSDSGVAEATVWQMPPLDVDETHGGVKLLQIDRNVSLLANPSEPQ